MFADYEDNGGNDKHNFYAWTSRKAVLQDYDLAIRVQLPNDFIAFDNNPIQLNYKTQDTNSANNHVALSLENGTGSSITLSGNTNLVSTSNNTWSANNIAIVGNPSFSAGEFLTLRLKLSTNNLGTAYVGEITLNYLGR